MPTYLNSVECRYLLILSILSNNPHEMSYLKVNILYLIILIPTYYK